MGQEALQQVLERCIAELSACLAAFAGRPHDYDPLPEIPACLLDPLWVDWLTSMRMVGRRRAGEQDGIASVRTTGGAWRFLPQGG
jgi:hypothetical protein